MATLRLWWAAPGAIVAGSAIGAAVVVGPTLGQQVIVPRQLVVPATAGTPAPSQTTSPAVRHPHPTATATATAPPGVVIAPTTRVVQPRHPVVTASADDSHERHDDSTEQESGDG